MGTCKYCGKSAGLFSHNHQECEEKHSQGVTILEGALRSYFKDAIDTKELAKVVALTKQNNFMTVDNIASSSAKCIDEWVNVLKRPYHSSILNKVKEFLNAVSVSYQSINSNGALDRLCQKLMRGFLADYFTDKRTLQRSLQISNQIMGTLPISQDKEQQTYYEMLGKAGKNFTQKGFIQPAERLKIEEYVSTLGLSLINLPSTMQGGYIEELGQATILDDLQAGRPPKYQIQAPIILAKGEDALWCYNNVTMYQEKIRKEYVGRTSGFSFKVMKGVRYRTGGFKGHPVETSYMENMGLGSLYITNRNIIFMGQTRSIKVPYTKIIGINPYSDGMEVQRDGNNVKRLVFQGFDCSFVLNVLSIINSI